MDQKNDIAAMRAALFETLRGIKDGTVDVEKAKAICEASQTIINSVKVEIDFARVTGMMPLSEFIPALEAPKPEPAPRNLREKGILPRETSTGEIEHPKPGVTVHRMRG